MTVDPRGRYLELFQATPPPAGPAWLRDLRTGAMDQFAATGFPSTKQEDWRFTSVAAIAETPFVLARGRAVRLALAASADPMPRHSSRGTARQRLGLAFG